MSKSKRRPPARSPRTTPAGQQRNTGAPRQGAVGNPQRKPPADTSENAQAPAQDPPAESELDVEQRAMDALEAEFKRAQKSYDDLRRRLAPVKTGFTELLRKITSESADFARHVQSAEQYHLDQAQREADGLTTINTAATVLEDLREGVQERRTSLDKLERGVREALDSVEALQATELEGRVAAIGAELAQHTSLTDRLRARLDEEQAGWLSGYEERRAALETELTEQRSEAEAALADERAGVAADREAHERTLDELARREALVRAEERELERRGEAIQSEAEALALLRVDAAESDAGLAEDRAVKLAELLDDRGEHIAALDAELRAARQRRIGDLDDAQVEALLEENRTLHRERGSQLGHDDRLRLQALVNEHAELTNRHALLQTHLLEVEKRAADSRLANETKELLERRIGELEAQKVALAHACDDLKQLLESLTETERKEPAFPNLVSYDKTLATPRTDLQSPLSLRVLVDELQRRLRHPAGDVPPLEYAREEIALFLAGMAMSRLHILQGPAGTGKTTLPLAIARALGGESRVVEVEAGWRDSLDLYGHYSSFERRFDERDFTKAVYAAGCAAHSDQAFIVVLDEMNLSRPEQYMSKILSSLEADTSVRRLGTFSIALANRALQVPEPRLLADSVLTATPNVWLVGTANNDETTETFAPKTYDRSFVMTMEWRGSIHDPGNPVLGDAGFKCSELSALFDAAVGTQRSRVERGLPVFSDPDLLEQLDLIGETPSSRFERQFRRFAAVLLACEGEATVGDAVDHFLAMRSLQSTPGRFGVTSDKLHAFVEVLDDVWEAYGLEGDHPNVTRVVDRARWFLMTEGAR